MEEGAKTALALWKEETGGKNQNLPTSTSPARNGRRPENLPRVSCSARHIFELDGSFILMKNFDANIARNV